MWNSKKTSIDSETTSSGFWMLPTPAKHTLGPQRSKLIKNPANICKYIVNIRQCLGNPVVFIPFRRLPSWFSNSAPSRLGQSKKFLTWPVRTKRVKSEWSSCFNWFQLVSIATVKSYEAIVYQTMKQLWSNYEATMKRLSRVCQFTLTTQNEPWNPWNDSD